MVFHGNQLNFLDFGAYLVRKAASKQHLVAGLWILAGFITRCRWEWQGFVYMW